MALAATPLFTLSNHCHSVPLAATSAHKPGRFLAHCGHPAWSRLRLGRSKAWGYRKSAPCLRMLHGVRPGMIGKVPWRTMLSSSCWHPADLGMQVEPAAKQVQVCISGSVHASLPPLMAS